MFGGERRKRDTGRLQEGRRGKGRGKRGAEKGEGKGRGTAKKVAVQFSLIPASLT